MGSMLYQHSRPWDYGMMRTCTEHSLRSPNLSVGSDQSSILAFTSDDREHRARIFKAPGWVSRQFSHCGCALCKSHTEPMVKLQWFNLCGRTRLQSFSRLLYLGLGFGLKTTASNHKIQTNISIKHDHTVKRNVMIFFLGGYNICFLLSVVLFHAGNQLDDWHPLVFQPFLNLILFPFHFLGQLYCTLLLFPIGVASLMGTVAYCKQCNLNSCCPSWYHTFFIWAVTVQLWNTKTFLPSGPLSKHGHAIGIHP